MIKNLVRSMGVAALILVGFTIVGTGLVVVTYSSTQDLIAEAQRAALEASLNQLLPPDRYDNRITEDRIEVVAPEGLGTSQPVTVYRARKKGQPVALFATPVAPDGYSGPIRLLIGVYADGTLAGVRILEHKETPGLGDGIEQKRSRWILSFAGKSLTHPPPEGWKVKKDGGVFDQFTGATITPRAVVKATRKFLEYVQTHRELLLAPALAAPVKE
ncbi:electron transport complex subunit RsxG [Candidatus Contendibacter odensensis]|uniref:Ion-translocating oxidoreductase complex subunit G n=1 Tax=Candidatus Contendobacter odensis Run_B_J11 TaxID=1400861 RepID=A0A7U7GAM6_9GAMM|nr:electron transport complex subunit RsxG [Candidatus Contendobacter odensis]CDH44587.1 Electron transport complex protein rnfG [Candidatus Contendobacter odensis Run_B_J11]